MRALLKAGADVNKADNLGCTALYRASSKGHTDIVHTLIKAGADVNKATNYGLTALFLASENGY